MPLQKEKLFVALDDTTGPAGPPGFPGGVKDQHEVKVSEEPVSQEARELKKEPQTEEQQPEINTNVRC